MTKKISTRYKIAIPLLLIGLLITFMLLRNPNDLPTLSKIEHTALYESQDNGYHQFLEAHDLLIHDSTTMWYEKELMFEDETANAKLRAYIKGNAPALDKLREGLAKPYVIGPYVDSQLMVTENLSEMRELGRQLVYSAELDTNDGHPEKAVNTYLDIIDFAQGIGQGGVEITNIVSIGIQEMGLKPTGEPIRELLPLINADRLNHLITTLERLDKKNISYEQVIANEKNAFSYNLIDLAHRKVLEFQMRNVMAEYKITYLRRDATIRILILQARLERYTRQHNTPPTNLEDIMNGNPIPIDPFTNKPFILKDGQPYSQGLEEAKK